ncbi:MAG: hypothetical protein ACXVEF_45025 [Polyangiales bacterium]
MSLARYLVMGACALGACHSGAPAPASAPSPTVNIRPVAESVALCKTTDAELRATLGTPYRDGRFGRNRILSWLSHGEGPEQFLAVLLNDHGVVVDLFWDVPGAVSWSPSDHCATEK